MSRSGKFAAMIVGASMLATGLAQALPANPPKGHLRYRGEPIQRARLMAQCWPNAEGAMGCSEKADFSWPAADEVQTGDRLRLRLQWKKQPQKVFVDSYREITDNGRPKGDGKRVDHKLLPVWRDGKLRAWNIRFRLFGERHHYVKAIVRWNGGTGVYGMHVRTVD